MSQNPAIAAPAPGAEGTVMVGNADAFVLRNVDAARRQDILARGLPTVLLGSQGDARAAQVWFDDAELGRTAARILLARGFRHCAYRGEPLFPSSVIRSASTRTRSAVIDSAAAESRPALCMRWPRSAARTAASTRSFSPIDEALRPA